MRELTCVRNKGLWEMKMKATLSIIITLTVAPCLLRKLGDMKQGGGGMSMARHDLQHNNR